MGSLPCSTPVLMLVPPCSPGEALQPPGDGPGDVRGEICRQRTRFWKRKQQGHTLPSDCPTVLGTCSSPVWAALRGHQ